MRGLRSIRRYGAGLGLFALLLQLTLSFAHIHPEDLLGSPAGAAERVAGNAQPAGPGQDRHVPGVPHDDCPICSIMHLAGTIVLPDAPVLALPTEFAVAVFAANEPLTTVIPRRLPFQTRAPPLA